MRKAVLLVLMGIAIKNVIAQAPASTHWFSAQLPVVFNKHWQWLNEASYRTLGESVSMNQLFLRTGARYTFNEKWNTAACYDLIFTRVSPDKNEHDFGKESRLWQEVNYEEPLNRNFSLLNRIRLEERFFEKTKRRDSFNAFRFRYRLGIEKDLSDKWSVQITDELMEQLQNEKLSFNQNRISVGGAFRFEHDMRLQVTYFWSQLPASTQHIFAIIFQKRIVVHAKGKS